MLNLRRKQILAQNQIEKMVKSKAELECLLTEKEHQLNLIKEKLHIRSLNDDDYDNENSSSSKKTQLQTSQQPSQSSDTSSSVPHQQSIDGRSASPSTSTASETKTGKDLANMLIFDAKDPNRPRFTLKELQKVLMEKNELTIKLDQTQEELEQLRKKWDTYYFYIDLYLTYLRTIVNWPTIKFILLLWYLILIIVYIEIGLRGY